MTRALAAATLLVLSACEERVQKVEVVKVPAPVYEKRNDDDMGPESAIDRKLSFECSQARRYAKLRSYGDSYLSEKCREELKRAREESERKP